MVILSLQKVLENSKVLVQGINLATYHQKPNPNAQIEGGIKKKELPIDISNVARYDSVSGKAMKLGVKTLEDGKKIALFNKANYLELAIYKSNPHTTGGASSLFGLSYRDIVTIKFN